MTNEKKQQMSFQFESTTHYQQHARNISVHAFSKEQTCVVRSIVNELAERKKNEEAKIFRDVLSRIDHLLR